MRKSNTTLMQFFLAVLMLCYCSALSAQTSLTVKGTVTDDSGSIVAGATVTVKGTTSAVSTDQNGAYSIKVPNNSAILVFSFISMKAQEIAVNGRTTINAKLISTTTALSDVVVVGVGYGSQRKTDVTGAVQRVTREELIKESPTNVLQAMQGKLAGVDVTQSEGAPGASIQIKVRGTSTFYGSSEPLYVIDGIPFNGSASSQPSSINSAERSSVNALQFLNPNDIESIDVLKDASATAIYGSRGANGVVLITTRRGKSGKDRIEFNFTSGVSQVAKKLRVLNAQEYATYRNEGSDNSNKYTGTTYTQPYPGTTVGGVYVNGPQDYAGNNFSWQDQIFRTARYNNYSMNISGGSDAGTHSLSFNYTSQEGTIIHSDFTKFGMNVNLNRNVGKIFTIGTSTTIGRSVSNGVTTNVQRTDGADAGVTRSALTFPPTNESVTDFSSTRTGEAFFTTNPVIYASDILNKLTNLSIFSSNYFEVKIIDGLKFRQNIGLNSTQTDRDQFYPVTTYEGYSANGSALKGTSGFNNAAFESLLNYNKTFGKLHTITAILGGTYEVTNTSYRNQAATNFPTATLKNENLALALNQVTPAMGATNQKLQSFLARVNYTYSDRYVLTASLRRDGSSKFQENPFAYFPSGAIAWRVSNENFLKNKLSYLSDLKLRFSYGQTGNQGIAPYSTYDKLISEPYIFNGAQQVGIGPDYYSGPGNAKLKWETTASYNLGMDLSLFSSRLNLTIDAYKKNIHDLLQSVTVPASTGFPTQLVNAGNVVNKGLEIAIAATPVVTTNFTWNTNFNIAFNRNKITSLGNGALRNFAPAISTNDQPFIQAPGHPIGAIYGYVEDGYYNSIAEVRANPANAGISDAAALRLVGEIRYKDLDGKPNALTAADRTYIGDVNPKFTAGLTNSFRYKDFDASILVTSVYGNDIINMNTRFFALPGGSKNTLLSIYQGAWRDGADNSNATAPKVVLDYGRQTALFTRRFIEDGSYVRLKNITFGYTVKTKFAGLRLLKVSVMANNLLTLTKYKGYDPEVNGYGNDAARQGVDLGGYPNIRSYNINIRASF
ncbi:SusC/RagA family TonB-linked outer membrane protein [Mucilaginibacter dorajii]|uniref:TonB-dependent receptor n=1 Tax=Mucilaginibacter dorajii TaxID=692994 RepID=A0ABP7QXU7_9SPHI|nr:TonB-dependent receptor [Mucilaginibacter dorajii]MCS3732448.1 TonB-linked SusC/RagA family outer membrane protein [Mucilaginibacter dorajii]